MSVAAVEETAAPTISKTATVIVTVADAGEPDVAGTHYTRVGRYKLSVTPEILDVKDEAMYVITWSFSDDKFDPTFLDPGVIFAQPTAPALPQAVPGNRKIWSVSWSNLEKKNRHSWPYNLHVRIGDVLAVLDPTVENQPPLNPTPY